MCILCVRGICHLTITIYQVHRKLDIFLPAEMAMCTVNHFMKAPGPVTYIEPPKKMSEHALKNIGFYSSLLNLIKCLS